MRNANLLRLLQLKKVITPTHRVSSKCDKIVADDPELAQLIINTTGFLRYSADFRTRLHCMMSDITHQPVCKICGTVLRMRMSGKYRFTFGEYCSGTCVAADKEVVAKRISTNNERYGSGCVFNNKQVKQKVKATNLQKYGVENVLMSSDIQKQIRATNLQKYGVENVLLRESAIRQQVEDTMVERYGAHNPFLLKVFQDKAKSTNMDKYGTQHAAASALIREKVNKTMIDLYGDTHYHSSQIPKDSLICLDDKLWLEHQHHVLSYTLQKISLTLGVSESVVQQRFKKFNIPVLTRNTSQFERDILEYIKSIYSGDVVVNTRGVITPKELDIYLPELKLAFECNGVFWHGETQGKGRKYHSSKSKDCSSNGVRLVHILDTEWYETPDIVKSRVSSLLNNNTTIYARKCQVKTITPQESAAFFNRTHIQGAAGATVHLGLTFEGRLVAALSVGKARYNKDHEWELIRYSNELFCTVVGGASKLFKFFVKTFTPSSMVTYSDLRWNTGTLYRTLGFKHLRTSAENYYYFRPENVMIMHHRSSFQKHKLSKKLQTFDPSISEWENMQRNGYDRIWDCGNEVFVWER